MSFSVCPGAIVAAPIEIVWENLVQPERYSLWANAEFKRSEPEGPAQVGQLIYLTASQSGRNWPVTFQIEEVDVVKHRLRIYATFPLGLTMRPTIASYRVDETSCRVQYG
jgi:hypothetical protein